jgi:hypothetical protein
MTNKMNCISGMYRTGVSISRCYYIGENDQPWNLTLMAKNHVLIRIVQ